MQFWVYRTYSAKDRRSNSWSEVKKNFSHPQKLWILEETGKHRPRSWPGNNRAKKWTVTCNLVTLADAATHVWRQHINTQHLRASSSYTLVSLPPAGSQGLRPVKHCWCQNHPPAWPTRVKHHIIPDKQTEKWKTFISNTLWKSRLTWHPMPPVGKVLIFPMEIIWFVVLTPW